MCFLCVPIYSGIGVSVSLAPLQTEKMLRAAEEVVGEYLWGQYDILVLPPSFAYGGMENPCLTFLSPSLLVCLPLCVSVLLCGLYSVWVVFCVLA